MNLKHQPWWLLAGIAACSVAQALPQQTQSPAPPSAPQATAAGVRVAIDPKTGQLRAPTEEEIQQLDQQAQPASNARLRRAEPLGAGKKGFVAPATSAEAAAAQRTLPTGGAALQVPESMMSSLTVHRDANGQLILQHGDDGNAPAKASEASDE